MAQDTQAVQAIEYGYDAESALKADNNANRLEHATPYVGVYKKASAVVSSKKGTRGIELEFDSPGNGNTTFTLWLQSADGKEIGGPGPNYKDAILYLLGLSGLKSVPGKVSVYDDELKERVEVDGQVFPQLMDKKIGMVFQEVLQTGEKTGKDFSKMEPYGFFQPETRLMVSELRDRKSKPEKLDKLVKGCKVKDQRKARSGEGEPAQPAIGAAAGEF